MAVSGSVNFSLTAYEIVEKARRELGIHSAQEPLSNDELQEGLKTLNMMLKAWQAEGAIYSLMTEGTHTLSQGDYDITFGSGGDVTTVPFDITDIRITRNSIDTPMTEMSRDEYNALPVKSNQGFPLNWFYDRQRSGGTLYVWPAPDSTAGTLKFTYRRIINDMDVNADDIDLPQEWYEAVIFNLAERMIPEYGKSGTTRAQDIAAKATTSYNIVKGFDTAEGEGSISILPYGMAGY